MNKISFQRPDFTKCLGGEGYLPDPGRSALPTTPPNRGREGPKLCRSGLDVNVSERRITAAKAIVFKFAYQTLVVNFVSVEVEL